MGYNEYVNKGINLAFWTSITAIICLMIIAFDYGAYKIKNNARLEKLEAASTTAQQPQERHYSNIIDSKIAAKYAIKNFHFNSDSVVVNKKLVKLLKSK